MNIEIIFKKGSASINSISFHYNLVHIHNYRCKFYKVHFAFYFLFKFCTLCSVNHAAWTSTFRQKLGQVSEFFYHMIMSPRIAWNLLNKCAHMILMRGTYCSWSYHISYIIYTSLCSTLWEKNSVYSTLVAFLLFLFQNNS